MTRPSAIQAIADAMDNGINIAEAADGVVVQVSLGSAAIAGQTVSLSWDGQAPIMYTLLAADITAGVVSITDRKSVV